MDTKVLLTVEALREYGKMGAGKLNLCFLWSLLFTIRINGQISAIQQNFP